jgi:DUF1680 family protein
MPMPVRRMQANPLVQADAGRAALMRGPLVYCAESTDNSEPVRTARLPVRANCSTEFRAELLGGVMTIKTIAVAGGAREDLYFTFGQGGANRSFDLTAIPYYANANRGPVDMTVWMPVEA